MGDGPAAFPVPAFQGGTSGAKRVGNGAVKTSSELLGLAGMCEPVLDLLPPAAAGPRTVGGLSCGGVVPMVK